MSQHYKYKIKYFLGGIYFRITGKTCKWNQHADLNYMLDKILKTPHTKFQCHTGESFKEFSKHTKDSKENSNTY